MASAFSGAVSPHWSASLLVLLWLSGLGLALPVVAGEIEAGETSSFDPGKLGFSASVNGEVSPYTRFYGLARPGEPMPISVVTPGKARFELKPTAGTLTAKGSTSWLWHPPTTAGLYPASLTNLTTGEVMTLQLFVLTPLSKKEQGRLQGFRVGEYPAPRPGQSIDRKPAGLVEVTAENRGTWLSPHFRLE